MNNYQQQTDSKRWLIIVTIMLVAILEVLDSTIVNVALPSMMPSLGADAETVTWVLTSYIVASAIMLPLTGFLSKRVGHKRLLIINISGFMVSSFLCGLSNSLDMMVVLRFFQGAFGAALIPLSQAILRQSFPLEEQGKAMAIWGMGVMVAPVFGPTLGGYITQNASWRWIFYINIPVCIIGILLTLWVIPAAKRVKENIDWIGIVLMFVGIGALQIFLDQGNTKDWFTSNFIIILCTTSIICLSFFILRSVFHKHPVIKLGIYKDRNFSLCCIALMVFAGCLFGLITLQPIMLETLFNYTSILAGMTMSPLGLASACGMIVSSQLVGKINIKYLLTASLALCAIGTYYFSTFDLNAAQINFVTANAIMGFGMGIFMVPLTTYALATIAPEDTTQAAGLYSYARMLGTSVGISLLSTLVTRETQINWNQLGAHVSIFSNHLRLWLQQTHMSLQNPKTQAILEQTIAHQANMIAFVDAYHAIAIAFALLIPVVWMMKNVSLQSTTMEAH